MPDPNPVDLVMMGLLTITFSCVTPTLLLSLLHCPALYS